MADNLFKLNNQSSEQIQLLKSIQQSQIDILGELSSLKKRISNIEQTPLNNSFHCSASDLRSVINQKASDISNAISNLSTDSKSNFNPYDDSIKKLNKDISGALAQLKSHTSSLVFGATFLIFCWFAAFVCWFWDVPAQTQAANNYAYEQTEKAKAAQNSK